MEMTSDVPSENETVYERSDGKIKELMSSRYINGQASLFTQHWAKAKKSSN